MRVLALKPDHLGDFALALPALWEAKQKIGKEGKIDILASPENAEWAVILDWIHRIIPIQHPKHLRPRKKFSPLTLFSMLAKGIFLRAHRYDYGIELTSSPNDPWGKLLLISSGAKTRCGTHGAYDFLLNEKNFIAAGHQTEILAARFPRQWQMTGKTSPRDFMPPHLRWENQKHENIILLSPFAGTRAKEWIFERWNELFQSFSRVCTVKILTPPERKDDALKICEEKSECLAPVNSISDTLRWLCRVKGVIAVDSATAHFAWLTGTPLVELFSGTTEPERWKSLGAQVLLEAFPVCYPCHLEKCNQPHHYCMQDISVDRVIQAAEKI